MERNYQDYAIYWYFMNRFALDSFRSSKSSPLILSHEEKLQDPAVTIEKLCNYLGFPIEQRYIDQSARKVGYISEIKDISEKEYELLYSS